tara:strand:- start:139 stop:780 length:642 start_codon:yes stop_codon:yes gene_type:complete
MQEVWNQLYQSWLFVASGVRDTFISSVFTSVLTAIFVVLIAKLSGRQLTQVEFGGINLKFAARESENAFKQRGETPPPRSTLIKGLGGLAGKWNVLWVDDHPENNRHEMEALSALGYSFRIARSNLDALQILKSEFFHLIISDIRRDEGESGLLLPKLAREKVGSIPFIFYTSIRTAPKTEEGYPVVVTPLQLFDAIREQILDTEKSGRSHHR